MANWTTKEISVLKEYAHTGPDAVSLALKHTCGTHRTPASVNMQAYRLGISMKVMLKCFECGFASTDRSDFTEPDLCRACATRAKAEKAEADVNLLESCEAGAKRRNFEFSLEQYEKAYDKFRQQKRRLRRKIGNEAVSKYEKVLKNL